MPRKNDIRILVGDDEPDVLELVVFHLEKQQYKVAVADTGDKALKMARENLPSMLILDLMLPGINGLEICRLLKRDSKTRNKPILMLTARAPEEDRVKRKVWNAWELTRSNYGVNIYGATWPDMGPTLRDHFAPDAIESRDASS